MKNKKQTKKTLGRLFRERMFGLGKKPTLNERLMHRLFG
jgi:hypothetical protein